MPLPDARVGSPIVFSSMPRRELSITIGDPEKLLWTSIRHMSSSGVVDDILRLNHGIASANRRLAIARELKPHIAQATAFYEAALTAPAITSPLLYYYCFLNLAKA